MYILGVGCVCVCVCVLSVCGCVAIYIGSYINILTSAFPNILYTYIILYYSSCRCVSCSCIYNFKFLFPLKCIFAVTPNDIFLFLYHLFIYLRVFPVLITQGRTQSRNRKTEAEYLNIYGAFLGAFKNTY